MKRNQAAGITTRVALLTLTSSTLAQSNVALDYNQNLTIRFFTSSQADTCNYRNTSTALTFTTFSVPVFAHCFNVADIFTRNLTSGYINQTRNNNARPNTEPGIHWQVFNVDKYDPEANYSSILYRQHVQDPGGDEYRPGAFADRRVSVFGGTSCTDRDPSAGEDEKKPLLPWYGFSCWSESEGSCGDTPYKIESFLINTGKEGRDGKCWDFAYYGAAGRSRVSKKVLMGALTSVLVAVWVGL